MPLGSWHEQQMLDQQQWPEWNSEPRGPGGEHYYSSPWATISSGRPQLASPAKLLRGDRFKQAQHFFRPKQQANLVDPSPRPLMQQQQQQHRMAAPKIVIKNQWQPDVSLSGRQIGAKQEENKRQPAGPNERLQQKPLQLFDQVQQQLLGQHRLEELSPIGPAQLLRIYQTADNKFHMTPPPQLSMADSPPPSPSGAQAGSSFEHDDAPPRAPPTENVEVQTVGHSGSQNGPVREGRFGPTDEEPATHRPANADQNQPQTHQHEPTGQPPNWSALEQEEQSNLPAQPQPKQSPRNTTMRPPQLVHLRPATPKGSDKPESTRKRSPMASGY